MNIRINKMNALYLAIFFIVFFQTIEESGLAHVTTGNYMNIIINVCRFFLLCACVVYNRIFVFTLSKFMFLALFFIAVIIDFSNGTMTLFDVLIVAVMAPKLDYYKILKTFFCAVFGAFIIIVLMSFTGIMPHTSFYRNGAIRETLGFQHPNLLSINVMALIILYILTRKRKKGKYYFATNEMQIDWIDVFLCIVASLFCYYVSNSLTETVILILMAAIFTFLKVRRYVRTRELTRSRLFKLICIVIIPLFAGLTYFLITNSRGDLIPDITSTFYNRYLYALYGYNDFGIHLFGISQETFNSFKREALMGADIDCLYIKILVRYGIILSLYFLFMCILCARKYIEKKNNVMILIIIILAIFSLFENRVLSNSKFSFIFICAFSEYYGRVRLNNKK